MNTTSTQTVVAERIESTPPIGLLDVIVLSGGPGAERAVSLKSGQAVADALERVGHRVVLGDIGPDQLSILECEADFVFIALHGDFGEDGAVQAELDRRGIPYSGSGAAASSLAMNKVEAKIRFTQCGLPTPRYELVTPATVNGIEERFCVPVVVKPIASGSSVDTLIPKTPRQLQSAVSGLIDRYGCALVESHVSGPELTCAILGDEALPVCEIRTKREFYNYEAKYIDDDTQYLFDLDLPEAFLERVRDIALQAHRALGCEVLSRVDVMVDEKNLEPYLLEINTIPGFTSHSLVPKAAARVGLNFDRLCHRLIELSYRKR